MSNAPTSMDELAEQVRDALVGADLSGYRELLTPDARWGPPGDDYSGCHNRDQILEWYQLGRDAGVRASAVDVTVTAPDRLLVRMVVTGRDPTDQHSEKPRWQVLTVRHLRVCDIRGYDDESEARQAAAAID